MEDTGGEIWTSGSPALCPRLHGGPSPRLLCSRHSLHYPGQSPHHKLPELLFPIFQDILKPRFFYQYKSQEERSQPTISVKTLAACIKYTLAFQLVTGFIGNVLIWRFRYQWINIVNPLLDTPSFSRYVGNPHRNITVAMREKYHFPFSKTGFYLVG